MLSPRNLNQYSKEKGIHKSVEMYKLYGFEYCKFIARIDKVTTEMCRTLDGQIFNLTELNVYSRYSSLDKQDVTYRTMGMKTGDNLPPINNHIHHCRSHIEPWKGGKA